MNSTEINQLLQSINKNAVNNQAVLILQGITLTITLLKPILMYWIQAKYNAPAPHESIRSYKKEDRDSLPLDTQSEGYGYIPGDDGISKYIGIDLIHASNHSDNADNADNADNYDNTDNVDV